jgi:hypothetical protein
MEKAALRAGQDTLKKANMALRFLFAKSAFSGPFNCSFLHVEWRCDQEKVFFFYKFWVLARIIKNMLSKSEQIIFLKPFSQF